MISAPNRLLPLNGNKWLLFGSILAIAFLLNACSYFRKAQAPRSAPSTEKKPVSIEEIQGASVYDPVKRDWVKTPVNQRMVMDTLRWNDLGLGQAPPITSSTTQQYIPVVVNTSRPSTVPTNSSPVYSSPVPPSSPGYRPAPSPPGNYPPVPTSNPPSYSTPDNGNANPVPYRPATSVPTRPASQYNSSTGRIEKLPIYNVAVALPFLTGKTDLNQSTPTTDNTVALWALNFYSGLKLGLNRLDQEGIKLNVDVVDTQADTLVLLQLLNTPTFKNAHLIIGPYRRDNIKIAANYARQWDKVLVSPYSAATNLTRDNPSFLQVSPSLESHCRAQVKDALLDFLPEEIVLVGRNIPIEQTCMEFCQKAGREAMLNNAGAPFLQYLLPGDESAYNAINTRSFLAGKQKLAFIIPSWMDETFVFYFLKSLQPLLRADQKVVVYGMPQWMDFQHMEFDLYERCHVRLSSNNYVDNQSPDVLNFRKDFFYRFGALPSSEAFTGYELMVYLGRMLNQYGTHFQEFVDSNPNKGIVSQFDFQKVVIPSPYGAEGFPAAQRYENQFVYLLEFGNFQFRPVIRP
jgi:hypothetical protein